MSQDGCAGQRDGSSPGPPGCPRQQSDRHRCTGVEARRHARGNSRAIDEALDVDAPYSARQKLAAKPNRSLVVEPLDDDRSAFALCHLDSESQKLLAARNLKILIADIDTLLTPNNSLLLRKIGAYIADPSPDTWKLNNAASRKFARFVSLTIISLNQAKSGLGRIGTEVEGAAYDPKAYQARGGLKVGRARLKASRRGSWRSASIPASGSFPGGTGCRPCYPWRPLP